jgi:uncharacterized membrane protein
VLYVLEPLAQLHRGKTMVSKFAEAIRLLCANFVLFSAIILTVWLPGNIFTNYRTFGATDEDALFRSFRINSFISLIFEPIAIGALIYSLAQLKGGKRPGYLEAMAVGFRNWGRVFVAQLLTSILITLALVVLIVPGVVLAVRYALLYPVVVLEGAGTDKARRRSTELTRGVRWQIFWAGFLFLAAYVSFTFLIYVPLELLPDLDTMATSIALDCVADIAFAPIQIVMFLYYWQAVERERATGGIDLPAMSDDIRHPE